MESIDQSWNPGPNTSVYAMTPGMNDAGSAIESLFVGGNFTTFTGSGAPAPRTKVAELSLANGAPTTWNPAVTASTVNALAVTASTVYAGGIATGTNAAGARLIEIERGIPNPAISIGWSPQPNGTVTSLRLREPYDPPGSQGDRLATLYVGGNFTSIGGEPRNKAAEINLSDGGTATLWNPNLGTGAAAHAFLPLTATEMIMGGAFNTVGSNPPNAFGRLAEVDRTNGLSYNWNPNANAAVYSLALDDPVLAVGGIYNQIGAGPGPARLSFFCRITEPSSSCSPAP